MKKTIFTICMLFVASLVYAESISFYGIFNKYKNAANADYHVMSVDERDYDDVLEYMGLSANVYSVDELLELVQEALNNQVKGLMEVRTIDLQYCTNAVKSDFATDAQNIRLKGSFESILNEDGRMLYVSENDSCCELLLISTNTEDSGITYFKGTKDAIRQFLDEM